MKKKNSSKNAYLFLAGICIVLIAAGFYFARTLPSTPSTVYEAKTINGVQDVYMRVEGLDYVPSTIRVKAGVPVKFVVNADRAEGCAKTFFSQKLNINTVLNKGDTVFEFTPKEKGTIPFSCTMNMARGQFEVV